MVAMVVKKQLAVTKKLGKDLLQSRGNINNAALLLATLTSSLHDSPSTSNAQEQVLKEALLSLEAFFLPLMKSGEFSPSAQRRATEVLAGKRGRDGEGKGKGEGEGEGGDGEDDDMAKADAIYKKWVWDRYREFVVTLLRFVARHNAMPEVQTAALHAIMELVRNEVQGEFNNRLYMKLCSTLVCSKAFNSDLLSVITSDYFKYLDVCYYTYSNMEKIAERRLSKKVTGPETISSDDEDDSGRNFTSVFSMVRNMYDVLINLPPLSQEDLSELWSSTSASEDGEKASDGSSEACKDLKKQRQRMNKAWLAFLRLPLPFDTYKKVLAQLHKRVIPFLSNPILLSDFLTNSYNQGGLISVMALNGLFILMTLHGLEYPDFFNKLYALLEPSIFVAKHRARFFELTDTCLKSNMIPAYLAAAFAKKLGRLALSAPPSGALVVIAMIHNLLRRHPSINHLVHRDASSTTSSDSEAKRGADPFLEFETDTAKCNALESSLWEIDTLRNHYCPAVSRFVASLETDLTVRSKTTEVGISDFSSGSYTTIFTEEVSKRLKAVPLAFYQTVPCSLFSEKTEDFVGWRFSDPPSAAQQTEEELPSKILSVGLDNKSGQAVVPIGSSGVNSEGGDAVALPKKKKHSEDEQASRNVLVGADKKKSKAVVSKGSTEEDKIAPLPKKKRK
ncbi:hypothetical protein KC19_7G098200 [Ceratodon purpureus]|uniref:CCAAT-binding factor domain-containing protein n=1 Tax=Ceratodon purpureus TaxID=3225 RepID=A0A8T0H4T2_CERPU|nr:hypothetical protein KC19_7G098200 [Ceratodon purpureus]